MVLGSSATWNGAEESVGARSADGPFDYAHTFPSAAGQNSATITVMKETLRAVFENGVFRPLTRPKGVAELHEVTLTVTTEERPSSLVDFAGRISSDDAQEMREIIEREFERVDPGEWQ